MDQAVPQRGTTARGRSVAIEPPLLLGLTLLGLLVSGIAPVSRTMWSLQVIPVLIGIGVLGATYRTFPLTPLAYRLVFLYTLTILAGAHYTYSRVPLGFWLQDLFDLGRNHFDRLGHFAQGFVPAILAREILLRSSPLKPGRWLGFLVIAVCLASSAAYELVEWAAATSAHALTGVETDQFLGFQADPWDSQWDMLLALVGAVTACVTLSARHDRALARLAARGSCGPGDGDGTAASSACG